MTVHKPSAVSWIIPSFSCSSSYRSAGKRGSKIEINDTKVRKS